MPKKKKAKKVKKVKKSKIAKSAKIKNNLKSASKTVDKKNIKIGKRNFGKVSVLDGVSEGDQIVVEGVSKVRDKSKIKIIKQKNR